MKNFPAPLFFADTSKKLLVNTQSAQKSFFQTLNNYALFETLLLQCVLQVKFAFKNTFLSSGWTQISSHSSFVSKLFLFPPWRNPMQFNHPKQFLNSLLTVPPHQNLLQPPYSISKAHFTTKSLSGPRSLGIPQTWRTQWEFSDRAWEFSFSQNGHLRWCLR